MITRIVKMEFAPEHIDTFLAKFHTVKHKIRSFEGCHRLSLLQDIHHPNVIFTYSFWDSQEALDVYRYSDLFNETWAFTKALFCAKPQAWSVDQIVSLD